MWTTIAPALALLVVAGCGGTVVFSDGQGGSGGDEPPVVTGPDPVGSGGSSADAVNGPGPVGPGPAGPGPGGPGGPGPGGGSSPGCSLDELFGVPECDVCALGACCAEAEACIADLERCATPEGEIDPASPLGGPFLACLEGNCGDACGFTAPVGDQLCDSGLSIDTGDPAGDAAFMGCFNASCCPAFAPCAADGDVDACVECLYGRGDASRCSAADACALEACGVGVAFVDVCGSGLVVRNRDVGLCMGAQCCDEAFACTSGGDDVESCDACAEAGGGPLCDALLACRSELCGG